MFVTCRRGERRERRGAAPSLSRLPEEAGPPATTHAPAPAGPDSNSANSAATPTGSRAAPDTC